MTIRVALEHTTRYDFDRAVSLGPHVVRLRPAPHSRTPIEAYSLRVTPEHHFLNWQQDPFGNFQARLVFPEKTRHLEVTVDLIADMTVINPFDFFLEESVETFPFRYDDKTRTDLTPYLDPVPSGPPLVDWLAEVDRTGDVRTIDFLVALNQRLAGDITYAIRLEPGVQDPDLTLTRAIGSCRDTAWLLVNVLRRLGLAARFVSGYLVQLTADEKPLAGPAGPEADFTDLHAWTEVFLPGAGWVGLDPTSGLFVGEGHIPLAATPSPATAAPISGLVDPAEVEFSFANVVRRIHEDPRVTKPYSDDQWREITELGRTIDRRLEAGDVRLTMGGEPTFVSIDDMEGEEWNIAADGPTKRRLALELTNRLHDRFAPGALVHHGQGKWYPGEPLPRWQHALIWRRDGVPIWSDRSLFADLGNDADGAGGAEDAEPGIDAERAQKFITALAQQLGLGSDTIQPGWEDPLYQSWQAALQPEGVEPSPDLDEPTGWVLPLHQSEGGRGPWATSVWRTHRGGLYLIPGDSAMGYRLPINALDRPPPPPEYEPSPFARLRPLPSATAPALIPERPVESDDDDEVPPTALCVEARAGRLWVFLPPTAHIVAALELVRAIEATAAEMHQPVLIEGYPLPRDPRLSTLVVTPDPGVIEVNLPPAEDWDELTTILEGVYAEARLSRLGTEKFDLDGTHTGTGGGNHVTIGGPTAPDSPLLRRPSLLRSLLVYWQHHPSLSYLFSGRFIGPSSQAPRVDEARDDNLYELETALAELDAQGDDVPPWIVDRLLRHLLVDLTGNTHRAEFCIDKLFSPDSERGRLGLLEMRAFEMPPHPRMALVQALVVRALVARCWEDPYRCRPARHGTALHDRFLLPWFIERDIVDVVDDLAAHDLNLSLTWLAPFFEFRFPRHGTVTLGGLTLELRGAIEPWHVLGEETTAAGMARYVDSSVERLQLLARGDTDGRYRVTCNGVPVPFTLTDQAGTSVAGIRYKAWAPPSGLHPTLEIDSPLTFDVVDCWAQRSIGGFRYHVVHPGGRSYDTFPVNAAEAESRRQSRFEVLGHTPGRLDPGHLHPLDFRDYPVTLDLRRTRRR